MDEVNEFSIFKHCSVQFWCWIDITSIWKHGHKLNYWCKLVPLDMLLFTKHWFCYVFKMVCYQVNLIKKWNVEISWKATSYTGGKNNPLFFSLSQPILQPILYYRPLKQNRSHFKNNQRKKQYFTFMFPLVPWVFVSHVSAE